MTEMEVSQPSLWVPIPGMYGVSDPVSLFCFALLCYALLCFTSLARFLKILIYIHIEPLKGFIIDLEPKKPSIELTYISNAFPRTRSKYQIDPEGAKRL